MAEKGDAKAISFVEDTAVAAEHLRDYIADVMAVVSVVRRARVRVRRSA